MSLRKHYLCLDQNQFTLRNYAISTIQPEDIELIRNWRNAQMTVLRQSAPIEYSQQIEYYSSVIWPSMGKDKPDNILFTFFHNNKRIGYGGLVHLSWQDKRAELSFLLDSDLTGNDEEYGKHFSAFIQLMITVAFERLNFHRLFTETYSTRVNHISFLESCGFVLEGTMRDHIILENKYVDSLIHSLINNNSYV